MSIDSELLAHADCRSRKSTCAYHEALRDMMESSKAKDAHSYATATQRAREASRDSEGFFPGFSLFSRVQKAQDRLSLVEALHARLDENFTPEPPHMMEVYRDPTLPADAPINEFIQEVGKAYADQSAFDSLEIEAAYTTPGFGHDAHLLHVFGQGVDADLTTFTPINAAHNYVMRELVAAVIDQWHEVKIDRGIQINPVEKVLQSTGETMTAISSHTKPEFPDDYPDDLRESAMREFEERSSSYDHILNEGWLYSFYKAVERAKNPDLFVPYKDGSNATNKLALIAFLKNEHTYWGEQWATLGEPDDTPMPQQAFFDGAFTSWVRWLEDI